MKESMYKSKIFEDDTEDNDLVKINGFWYQYLKAEASDLVEKAY